MKPTSEYAIPRLELNLVSHEHEGVRKHFTWTYKDVIKVIIQYLHFYLGRDWIRLLTHVTILRNVQVEWTVPMRYVHHTEGSNDFNWVGALSCVLELSKFESFASQWSDWIRATRVGLACDKGKCFALLSERPDRL